LAQAFFDWNPVKSRCSESMAARSLIPASPMIVFDDEGDIVGEQLITGIIESALGLSDEDTCDGCELDCNELESLSGTSHLQEHPIKELLRESANAMCCREDDEHTTHLDVNSDFDYEEVFHFTLSDGVERDDWILHDDTAQDFTDQVKFLGVHSCEEELQGNTSKTCKDMEMNACDAVNSPVSGVKPTPAKVRRFVRAHCPQKQYVSSLQQLQAGATACKHLAPEEVQVMVNWSVLKGPLLPDQNNAEVCEGDTHVKAKVHNKLMPVPPSSPPRFGFCRHANKDWKLTQETHLTIHGLNCAPAPRVPVPPLCTPPSAPRPHRPMPPRHDTNPCLSSSSASYNTVVPPPSTPRGPQSRAGRSAHLSITSEDLRLLDPGRSQYKPSAMMLDLGIDPTECNSKPPRCISARPKPIYSSNEGEVSERLVVKSKRATSLLPAIGHPHRKGQNVEWIIPMIDTAVECTDVPLVS